MHVLEISLPSPPPCMDANLSESECAVLELLLEGLSNQAIADRRGTAVRTVANQVASIFRKAGVSSRRELVVRYGGG